MKIFCKSMTESYLKARDGFFSYFIKHSGNKCDMDDKRLISEERGRNVAEENGIKFFETSAKDNINIEQAFITVSSDRNF